MAEAVYILCAVLSAACAALLLRGFLTSRARLLLWSALCFAALAANNLLLIVDVFVVPETDLQIYRHLTALVALCVLIFGLVWESR